MTMTHDEKLAMARECAAVATEGSFTAHLAPECIEEIREGGHDDWEEVQSALLAIDRMQERVRAEGQAEGFASAIQQLRDMRGQKPQPAFARVAEMLALRLEQSRIPCAAIRENPHAEG